MTFIQLSNILLLLLETPKMTRVYLVKWCSLPYMESTWETAEDIKDDQKIEDFVRFNTAKPVVRTFFFFLVFLLYL